MLALFDIVCKHKTLAFLLRISEQATINIDGTKKQESGVLLLDLSFRIVPLEQPMLRGLR